MSGKLKITGSTSTPRDPQDVRAYCEGRQAGKDGKNNTDNPFPLTNPSGAAWLAGHQSWTLDPAGKARDCCAIPYGGGFVPAP